MSQSRLTTALDDGLLSLPDGAVTVMRAPQDYDLSGLSGRDIGYLGTFWPEIDAWAKRGVPLAQAVGDIAIVVLPRAKALARAMIAQAAAKARLVVVDGQRTEGVDSIYKDCRARLGDLPNVAKSHGRLFWFDGTDAFADWAAPAPAQGPEGFYMQPGVFSDGAIDRGSALLAAALPAKLPSRMADFGAGWGYLSAAVLARDTVATLDLVEAERLSLDCARLTLSDPRASFHWADVTQFKPDQPYGGIVMNPPFHTGRAADPALGIAFIAAAARALTGSGQLWMVANRHLPYETALRDRFKTVEELGGDAAFKLFHATRPKR
jgi:16S rRNA (guanine1207-N2)-methyltransferase